MKDFLKKVKLNEQNISMALGVIVVVLVAGLLISYFKSVNKKGEVTSTSTTKVEEPTAGNEYTVVAGDSLWTISQKAYGSGYNWTEIYAANKEVLDAHPNLLYVGSKLTLPKLEVKEAISYTVQTGDNLWNIAVKTCQNGYTWVKTANENKLANPNLLYVGQTLKIFCD
mgnify:FL=1